MPVSRSDINNYTQGVNSLKDKTVREFRSAFSDAFFDTTNEELRRRILLAAKNAAQNNVDMARELAAEFYEYSAEAAGVSVDPAYMDEWDYDALDDVVGESVDRYLNGEITYDKLDKELQEALENEIRTAARSEILENLERDYRAQYRAGGRGAGGVRYARVPTGDSTCAFCLMLASRGAVYRSESSAQWTRGVYGDPFHPHCDCAVVAYGDPESIEGFEDDYERYQEMYYSARKDWQEGNYSDKVASRMETQRKKYEAEGKKWTSYHAICMVMREKYGLDH